MQYRNALGYFLFGCIAASTAIAENEDFRAQVRSNSQLTHLGDLKSYVRALKSSPGSEPWERQVASDFDKTQSAPGTVYSLHSRESCAPSTPGRYSPSDCGTDTAIVFNRQMPSSPSRARDKLQGDYLGVMFLGTRYAPGDFGCFGFAENPQFKLVRETKSAQIVDVKADFKLFQLRRFPKTCDSFHLERRVEFLRKD